jgi:hypothetical protein
MVRLLVHVEGETEETFSNEILRPYLLTAGYESVSARIIGMRGNECAEAVFAGGRRSSEI